MTLTSAECFGYAVLYACMWFGIGFWLRRVVESVKPQPLRRDG